MLSFIEDVDGKRARYLCDCGNETIVFKSNATRGTTVSCGCFRRKVTRDRSVTHGHKSGGTRSRTYVTWVNMKGRCNNPDRKDAKNYVGRGISYCPEWEEFDAFLRDMGEAPEGKSLDRIDNERGYSKENCRWATRQEQNLNKRSCVHYTLHGKTQTLAEWAREIGMLAITLHKRLQRGVPIELAFTNTKYLKVSR